MGNKLSILLLVAAMAVPSVPCAARAGEGPMEGLWDTPYGRVKIQRDGEQLIGKLVEPGHACNLKKDAEVLHGRLEDDLFTGELMVCYPCHDEEWVLSLAMLVQKPERVLGSLGPLARSCNNSVSPRGWFTFYRPKPVAPPPTLESRPMVSIHRPFKSEEAKALYMDARAALGGIDLDSPATALKKLRRADQIERDHPDILELQAEAYRRQGPVAKANMLDAYRRLARVEPAIGFYDLACLSAEDHNQGQALRYLNLAAEKGFSRLDDMLLDKDLESLHDDAEWQRIIAKVERNKRHGH